MMTLNSQALAFLLPLPFLAAMAFALLMPRSSTRIGYLGSVAGVATLLMLLQLWDGPAVHATTVWLSASGVAVPISVLIDKVSMLFVGIVAGIGVVIFSYSVGYFEPGEDMRRYYAALALFAMAMIDVVTSGNLVQLFFFWELVGVSSYLLIGFWHRRETASEAARKAFLTIIVGDAFLLGGILLLWHTYGTFDVLELLRVATAAPVTVAAGVCIIIGAISKSAQFPLHAWLPDAMEGPTPVSAFLHSATMVKAGLFLVLRMLPLLVLVGLSPLLVEIAAVTILLSALCALVENDIKRVLAYSTMNQLGFILLAIGIGATTAGMYHLLNHSIFKALLFLCAGAIIHIAKTQDLRRMNLKLGGLLSVSTAIGALALAGMPIFVGFFSKDAIFESIVHRGNVALVVLFCAAVLASSVYIFRWYFLIFHRQGTAGHVPWEMRAPLPVLAALCVLGGLAMPAFYGRFGTALPELGTTTLLVAVLSTLLALLGLVAAYFIYRKGSLARIATRGAATPFYAAASRRFMLDDMQLLFASAIAWLGTVVARIDGGINRALDLLTAGVSTIGGYLRRLVDGSPISYVTGVIIGFLVIALILRFV